MSVDLPILGQRLNECRNEFAFPQHLSFPNLAFVTDETVSTDDLDYGKLLGMLERSMQIVLTPVDPSAEWNELIPWLRQHTKLEIWLKGSKWPRLVD